ncbi:NACHT and WD40 repeat domain-containing protein [Thomasclavelia cocleata]|uniref:NACHT and WD40 repeat domain-containing protein n=1 Tax=Thomasclavelia cocleata TaxID=69824 RepID=UPI00261B9F20|nr:hypothetical protein [Thomasclavelia cocleata]
MKDGKVDLYSSIMSAIFGVIGIVSSGRTEVFASIAAYAPAVVVGKMKQISQLESFDGVIEKQLIQALLAAIEPTYEHLKQENEKEIFHQAAIRIKSACKNREGFGDVLCFLKDTLVELQIDLEQNQKYVEWITRKSLKNISKTYQDELNKIIAHNYHELGIYLHSAEIEKFFDKIEEFDIKLDQYNQKVNKIELINLRNNKNLIENIKNELAIEQNLLYIIKKFFYENKTLCNLLEGVSDDLFPVLKDETGVEHYDMNYTDIPLCQYITDKWIEGNETKNLILTAEGGMGKTISLLKSCETMLQNDIMCMFIPLYRMESLESNNIEKYILKHIFKNDEKYFNLFYSYINRSSGKVKLVLMLDGFNETLNGIKNILVKEINDLLLISDIRLIITSRYDFRSNYGLKNQFQLLEIQQLNTKNIAKYLGKWNVKAPDKNSSLYELLGFPLLISLYAKTEEYYYNNKNLSFIEWFNQVDAPGKIIWNYLQCQIMKPQITLTDESNIYYFKVSMQYIVPYISWSMICEEKFFYSEQCFVEKLNESIKYLKKRWKTRKPWIIQKIELDYSCGDMLWDCKRFYKTLINDIHIFEKNFEGEYSLIHHKFRDCFGAIFLINEINHLDCKLLPLQFKATMDEEVLNFIDDLSSKKLIKNLWSNYRFKLLDRNSCELKNLFYIINKNYQYYEDEITFSGMDLRNVSLNGMQFCKDSISFDSSYISYYTFIPNQLDSSILCMCVLKKSKFCLGGLTDHTVRVWDIDNGSCIYVLKGHEGKVTALGCSPDEKICLSGAEDCTLILWDLESGNKKQILTGHKAEIKRILFIDNNIVKSYSVDGIVRTWNIEKCICIGNEKYQKKDLKKDRDYDIQLLKSGEVIIDSKTKLVGHEKEVIHYEYFPENNLFFSLSLDKSIKVWDTCKGKCVHTYTGFSEWENIIDISFEKNMCVSGAYDETIRLWDIEAGKCIRVMRGHTDFMSSVKLVSDGSKCITGSYDNTAKIWDLFTGECLHTLVGHTGYVRRIDCTKDGKLCITASYDGSIRVWEIDSGKCIHTFIGHNKGVWAINVSSDGKYCISGSHDCTAKLWSLETGICLRTYTGHQGAVRSVRIIDDENVCLTSCIDKKIRKWDINNGELVDVYDLSFIDTSNPHFTFCYKRDCVVYHNNEGVIIYNYVKNEIVEQIKYIREDNYHISDIDNILLSSDGKYCISGSNNTYVDIYELKKHKHFIKLKAIPYMDVIGLSFSNAKYEGDEIKNIIYMSGGII